jgi:hypothetical protein
LSTGVVFGDVWRGGVAARPRVLADSDFSFIALSSEVVSGAVWDGLSSAMLSAAVASATVNIHVQTKIIVRFDFISFWLQSTLGDRHYKSTRSRVSFFMNKFRELGFIDYNGSGLEVHTSLLNAVLHDQPQIQT